MTHLTGDVPIERSITIKTAEQKKAEEFERLINELERTYQLHPATVEELIRMAENGRPVEELQSYAKAKAEERQGEQAKHRAPVPVPANFSTAMGVQDTDWTSAPPPPDSELRLRATR
jgi:hypothetical protein